MISYNIIEGVGINRSRRYAVNLNVTDFVAIVGFYGKNLASMLINIYCTGW
jgi:hypothetical protein